MPAKRKFDAFDASGRRYETTEQVWRDEVLPSLMKQHWNAADALYGILHVALSDGFFKEALPGAKQLSELEPNSRRPPMSGISPWQSDFSMVSTASTDGT